MTHVILDSASVTFPVYGANTRLLKNTLLKACRLGGNINAANDAKIISIKALNNLSLDILEGDIIGLVGHNGSGKSTLLKLIAGIYEPTSGYVDVQGKITTIFSIFLGIDQEATGYENITICLTLRGLTKTEILNHRQQIIDFTELGDFLHLPLRTYSQGMQLRLAFAIATSFEADILLLDEIIGAGDKSFASKARNRLRTMMNKAKITILATHNDKIIQETCNKILELQHGQIKFYGSINEYNKLQAKANKITA